MLSIILFVMEDLLLVKEPRAIKLLADEEHMQVLLLLTMNEMTNAQLSKALKSNLRKL